MENLECPSEELWDKRRRWFQATEEKAQGKGNYLVSEQACALTIEVQTAFCAGAWAGVIILAMAVVDAALRETEIPGFAGSTKKLIELTSADPRLQKMRKRRNALVHIDPENPALTVDQQWIERDELETEAREAVKLMFEAFFISPSV